MYLDITFNVALSYNSMNCDLCLWAPPSVPRTLPDSLLFKPPNLPTQHFPQPKTRWLYQGKKMTLMLGKTSIVSFERIATICGEREKTPPN